MSQKSLTTNRRMYRLAVFFRKYGAVYLMFLPVLIYYLMFHYKPLLGIVISFKNYTFADGIWGSAWVGLKHFKRFLNNPEFWRVFKNTVVLAVIRIAFTFPMPIILALMFNEVRNQKLKKVLQTISYLPHFVSFVIVYAVFYNFFSYDGLINSLRTVLGYEKILFLGSKAHYRGLFVGMAMWKETGWNAIIYLAALSRVSPELYEAAEIDGAGKFKQILHVTLPAIRSIISIKSRRRLLLRLFSERKVI